jgi:hypothetical protein
VRDANEEQARDAARTQVDGLEDQAPVVGGAAPREKVGADERGSDPPPGAAPTDEHMLDSADDRSAVVDPARGAGAAEATPTPAADPTAAADAGASIHDEPLPLGTSGFDHKGRWIGPVQDLLSGEPGEDHDPLPPGESEEVL